MKTTWRNPWTWVLCAWIGLIFFSSTSLAGKESEQAFAYLSSLLFPHLPHDSSSFGAIHLIADKGVHVTLFTVLGTLLWIVLPDTPRKITNCLLFGAVVGSCSEMLQSFFPDRDPAIRDVLINTFGTAVGVVISIVVRNVLTNKLRIASYEQ
jgi:VanZ family protein